MRIGDRGERARSEPMTGNRRGDERVNAPRARLDRRRSNILAEIERNRRREYNVPSWELMLVLVAMMVAIVAFVAFV